MTIWHDAPGHRGLVFGHSFTLTCAVGKQIEGSSAMFDSMARTLIILGVVLALVGGLLLLVGKIPFLGRLPGDIVVRRGNWSFYFPLATSILISIVLTLLFSLFGRR